MYVLYIAVLYNCSESDKQILKNIYFAYRMHIEHSLHSLPISSHYHDALLILAYRTYVWRPTANVLYCIVLYCIYTEVPSDRLVQRAVRQILQRRFVHHSQRMLL